MLFSLFIYRKKILPKSAKGKYVFIEIREQKSVKTWQEKGDFLIYNVCRLFFCQIVSFVRNVRMLARTTTYSGRRQSRCETKIAAGFFGRFEKKCFREIVLLLLLLSRLVSSSPSFLSCVISVHLVSVWREKNKRSCCCLAP